MASPLRYPLLALPLLFYIQASTASGVPNVASILTAGGQFTILLELLKERDLVEAIKGKLETSCEGLTILAPTDVAFGALPPGLFGRLSAAQQARVLLLHALPKYYSFGGLAKAEYPLPTLAEGFSLSVVGIYDRFYVSSGVVTTLLNCPIYDKPPLAIFPLDAVLIPPQVVG